MLAALVGTAALAGGERREWVAGTYQLSVWGPDQSQCKVTCGSSQAELQKQGDYWQGNVSCNVGDKYTFNFGGGEKIDYLAEDITQDGTASVVSDPSVSVQKAPAVDYSKAVVYEMHIPSFTSEGTFAAAEEKLSYIANLGITLIELMPVAYFSGNPQGWGYDPTAPWAVQPAMGGSAALKSFVKKAQSLGLGVLLDIVFNHWSGSTELASYGADSFTYSGDLKNTPWGPRPNYGSTYILESFLEGKVKNLVDNYGVSGFRWDSTICIRKSSATRNCWESGQPDIQDGITLMKSSNEWCANQGLFTVAEDNQNDFAITTPVSQGGYGFTGQWGSNFFYDIQSEIVKSDSSQVDVNKVAKACSFANNGDPNQVAFTENHDKASNQNGGRIPKQAGTGWWASKRAMLGIAMTLTCRGYPMLLQGQEYLETKAFDYPVPPKFDWSAATSSGAVQETRDLLRLRTNADGISGALLGGSGSTVTTLMISDDSANKVAVMLRSGKNGQGQAIIFYNMYDTLYTGYVVKNVPQDGLYKKVFDGDDSKYDSAYESACKDFTGVQISGGQGSVCVPKMSTVILVKQ